MPEHPAVVNAAFAPLMDGDRDTLQARYVPLEPASRGRPPGSRRWSRCRCRSRTAQRFVAARAIEQSLPDAVGAYVDWLVRRERLDGHRAAQPRHRVPLEARHICILFRRFVSFGEDITRPYVDALEARGVHHLLVGGKAFHDREEIETLRAALTAIEWPDDQLSVFATLRGALFAIGDEELLEYQHIAAQRFTRSESRRTLPAELAADSRRAERCCATLHARAQPPAGGRHDSALLDATRAHVGFVLRPGGEQVLANVLHVAELARQYELDGGMSFRGFVEALREAAQRRSGGRGADPRRGQRRRPADDRAQGQGAGVPGRDPRGHHRALTPWDASRHVDLERGLCALRIGGWSPKDLNDHKALELAREQKEGERVAYVAATRARDLLVVPAVGDEPYTEGWVSPLNAAIYPAETERRVQQPANGCPAFQSKDSVLQRPNGDPASRSTVCPGAASARERTVAHGGVVVARVAGLVSRSAGAVRSAPRRSDRQGRAARGASSRSRHVSDLEGGP